MQDTIEKKISTPELQPALVSFEQAQEMQAHFDMPTAVQAETFDRTERDYNDITTWAAEVLDGNMRTEFEYSFDGKELYAGDGSPMGPIFEKAIVDAKDLAEKNPILKFEIDRRETEYQEYLDMLEMAKGNLPNTMIVISDFPQELKGAGQNIGGYNLTRMQTMQRTITAADGKIKIGSQSLDRSDRDGLENIYGHFGLRPKPGRLLGQRIYQNLSPDKQDTITDELVGVYDRTLQAKYGKEYYAGRTPAERENTYNFVIRQEDLVNAYLANQTKDNQYAFAAALDRRWKADRQYLPSQIDFLETTPGRVLTGAQMEMNVAAIVAQRQGKSYSGCGFTATAGAGIGAPAEFAILGYGNPGEQAERERLSWHGGKIKEGVCVSCDKKTKVGVASWCKECINC